MAQGMRTSTTLPRSHPVSLDLAVLDVRIDLIDGVSPAAFNAEVVVARYLRFRTPLTRHAGKECAELDRLAHVSGDAEFSLLNASKRDLLTSCGVSTVIFASGSLSRDQGRTFCEIR